MSAPLLADAATLAKGRALKGELLRRLVGVTPYATDIVLPETLFPRRGNLVGVGYGVKVTKDSHGANEAIRVYVRRKRTKRSLSKRSSCHPTSTAVRP